MSCGTQYIVETIYGDIEDYTQKSGSRNADGNVPNTYLNDNGKFNVNWNNLDNTDSKYGIRSEVSHKNLRLFSGILCLY